MNKVKIILILLIVSNSCYTHAQENLPVPKLLAIDTVLSVANVFNDLILQYAPGFRMFGVDKQHPGNIIYTYTNGDGSLHLAYKYQAADGRQTVDYQSITADLSVIMPVFNGLFGAHLPADIDHTADVNGTISYLGKHYQCMLEADDRREGYWVLSFVRSY